MSKEIMQGLGLTMVLGLAVLFSFSFWTGSFRSVAFFMPGRAPRTSRPEKLCYANQRVLRGAIEMYNMDNSVMIPTVNHKVIFKLTSEKYLKSSVTCSEGGSYSGTNLLATGVIACSRHGSPP